MKRTLRVLLATVTLIGAYALGRSTGLAYTGLGLVAGYLICWVPRDIGAAMGE